MKIGIIAGARPNFMKVAPLCHELRNRSVRHFLVNTGQHFSTNMSESFFDEFRINPEYSFKPSRDSVVAQMSDIMLSLEKVFSEEQPDVVVVVGDVNSTVCAAIVANKMQISLAHVEAGLRSYNKNMPEENNRVVTDRLSDLLLVTSEEGVTNLAKEGITENVEFVGNIMIDTLVSFLPKVADTTEEFYFCTLHRAENIDNKTTFAGILDALEEIAHDAQIYLPLHPRTKKMAKKHDLTHRMKTIFTFLEPLSYKDSLYYQKNAKLVLTDSGGIQEETSYLGSPCITLRTETERPITVTHGTNKVGGVLKADILSAYRSIDLRRKTTSIPYWDGKTAGRIVDRLTRYYRTNGQPN